MSRLDQRDKPCFTGILGLVVFILAFIVAVYMIGCVEKYASIIPIPVYLRPVIVLVVVFLAARMRRNEP